MRRAVTLGRATPGGGGTVDRRRPRSLLLSPCRGQGPAPSSPGGYMSPARREVTKNSGGRSGVCQVTGACLCLWHARLQRLRDEQAVNLVMGRLHLINFSSTRCLNKKGHFIFAHNFDICQLTFIFFGRRILVAKRLFIINPPNAFCVICFHIANLLQYMSAKNYENRLKFVKVTNEDTVGPFY